MVQKEVIARLNAKVGDSEYGPLAILLDLLTERTKVMNIPREAFYPQPNVTSTIFHIRLTHIYDNHDVASLFRLIKAMFLSRRKTIFNNLAIYLQDKEKAAKTLENLSVSMNMRPEQLPPSAYLNLYLYLKK